MEEQQHQQMGHHPLSLHERVAVLESQHLSLNSQLSDMSTKLDELLAASTKYRGTLGGIALTVTAIVSALGLLKDWIVNHLK